MPKPRERIHKNFGEPDSTWLNTPENQALEYLQGSQGQGLESSIQALSESGFSHNFADVRVHADSQAASVAGGVAARAFTVGHDIVFNAGEYQPHSREGQGLIAHELAHTVQQRNIDTKALKNLEIASRDSEVETQAQAASTNALAGHHVQMPASSEAMIARETKDQAPQPADDARPYTTEEEKKLHDENVKAAFQAAASEIVQKYGDQIKNWQNLTLAQREEVGKAAIKALNTAFTKDSEIKDESNSNPRARPQAPKLVLDPKMAKNNPGANRDGGKTIALNPDHLLKPSFEAVFDTIGHEFTHTQQERQSAKIYDYISPRYSRNMALNLLNYKPAEVNHDQYQDQPVEVDARAGGLEFSTALTQQMQGQEQKARLIALQPKSEIQILENNTIRMNGVQVIRLEEVAAMSDTELKTALQVSERIKKLHPESQLHIEESGTIHLNGQTQISAKELASMSDKDVQAMLKASHKLNLLFAPKNTENSQNPTKPTTPTQTTASSAEQTTPTGTRPRELSSSLAPQPNMVSSAAVPESTAVSAVVGRQAPLPEGGVEASKAAANAGNMSFMNARNPNWTWGLSENGLTGTSTDGMTTRSQRADVSFQDGFGFTLGQSRMTEPDKDHSMGSSYELSYKDGAMGWGWGSSGRAKDTETGIVYGQSTSNNLGFGANGFSASRNNNQTTEIDGQKFSSGSSTSYNAGNFMYTTNNSHTTTNEHGEEVTTGNSQSFSAGRDGLGYNTSSTDAKGNTTSFNTTANAGLDSSGNLNNLQAGAGFSRNNKSVSVHGGYSVEASEPRQQGETWVVDWSRTLNAGGKAGGSKGPANIGAGATYTDSEFGTRNFKTKTEAEAFQKDAAARLPSQSHDPSTVAGALQLEIGESLGHGHGLQGSVSGGVSLPGGGNIGGGATRGSSSSLSVRRVSATIFDVTDESSGNKGKSFSMGTFVGGATGHGSEDHTSSRTLRFDLATPAGRAAFDAFNKDTSQIPDKGARVISSTESKGEDSGTTVNLPGHSNDRTSRVEEAITQDQAGKLERYTGKATEQISTEIPFFDKTHDNVGVQFDATERNDRDSKYALSGSVDSSDGSDSIRHLAALTSSAYRTSEGAKSSGKWAVEVEITDAMVDTFVKEIGTERVRKMGLFDGSDPRNDLREHLRDAKTSDDKKRALARFFADAGHDGKAIKQMREVLTGGYVNEWSFGSDYESLKRNKLGNFEYDLTLPGDRNFKGMGARLELEGKIRQYQQLIAANPQAAGTLHGEIAPLLEEVRRQRNEINDPKRYSDLPDELREHQVARLEGYIESLNGLRVQAGESLIEADAPKPQNDKGKPDRKSVV